MAAQTNGPVSTLESRPASLLSWQQLADLTNLCFTGYIGDAVSHTPESMAQAADVSYVRLEESLVFYDASESLLQPVAFAFIALRDGNSGGEGQGVIEEYGRLVSMGVVPQYQGRKVGGLALSMVIDAVRDKGMEVLELECIRENTRGVKLYKNAGFEIVRELAGWERDGDRDEQGTGEENSQLQECSVQEVRDLIDAHGAADDLPWQVWGFHRSMTPQQAFHIDGEAYCVVAEPASGGKEGPLKISCLFVKPEHRGKGASERLAKALSARFPGRSWTTQVIFPVEYGEKIAARTGFRERRARLYQMRLKLR